MIGHKGKPRPLSVRFWEKVQKTDTCWIWLGAIDNVGYGSIRINGQTFRSHRVSYELKYGSIPNNDLCVLHRCDNRRCVNPDHLFLGTKKDNTFDMINKGRAIHPKGIDCSSHKLSENQVLEIRMRYANGESTRKITKDYPVSASTIWAIVTMKKWSHLGEYHA